MNDKTSPHYGCVDDVAEAAQLWLDERAENITPPYDAARIEQEFWDLCRIAIDKNAAVPPKQPSIEKFSDAIREGEISVLHGEFCLEAWAEFCRKSDSGITDLAARQLLIPHEKSGIVKYTSMMYWKFTSKWKIAVSRKHISKQRTRSK